MLSLAVKTHWKIAFRTLLKAIKVTIQDIKQTYKANHYHNKVIDQIMIKRAMDKYYDELSDR